MTTALMKRKRKFWMMLPVLALPFCTFLFWKFDGGQAQATTVTSPKGLNLSLPDATLKDQDNWTKMDYYKKAEADSSKILAQLKKDPEHLLPTLLHDEKADEQEKKLTRQLAAIEKEIDQAEKEYHAPRTPAKRIHEPDNNNISSRNVEKLEKMMQHMQQPLESDPELAELNKMLDKLVAMENPSVINANHQSLDSVKGLPVSIPTGLVEIASDDAPIEFYGLPRDYAGEFSGQPLIKTVVAKNITVQQGTTVPLQLLSKLSIAGQLLPAGTIVYATANVQGAKLLLTVNGIIFREQLLPVLLTAYDRTGVAGIAIRSSGASEFSRQTTQRTIGNIGFNSINPTLEGQIAEAGLQTAKGLIHKKVKVPTVQLQAGDEILLIDQSSQKQK